jgi:hypothetical protein
VRRIPFTPVTRGPFLRPMVEVEEVLDEEDDGGDETSNEAVEAEEEEKVEEGDRVFMTAIKPEEPVVDICATGNFSQ